MTEVWKDLIVFKKGYKEKSLSDYILFTTSFIYNSESKNGNNLPNSETKRYW